MARQNFLGLVVSQGRMQKTVKVRVETKVFNRRINKELFRRKDYLVHDEGEISREGDLVRIEATRPLSKRKFFAIAEIIKNKGQQFALYESQAKTQVAEEETAKTEEFLNRRATRSDSGDSVLLSDILIIQDALSKGQSSDELIEIKKRYGVQDFTPETVKQLLQLDVTKLESQLQKQRSHIDIVQERVQQFLKDEASANEYLKSHGVEDPMTLKKNIRKNIIRKHILRDLQM
ncbi:MRPS17 (YMR188C) [Zygosaccharomyces parabailii]|nr:MRPS17 (YMR188C) [Zygosaccharomyces parabailii]CDH12867.1 probable 37S ribosomal protein S17,mitochondrial [Zygosaccharomyces bailii ISA1307]